MFRNLITVLIIVAATSNVPAANDKIYESPRTDPLHLTVWNSSPPNDCPLERSKEFKAVGFTGAAVRYFGAFRWHVAIPMFARCNL